jgi:Na+/melibiose symporter-like transporter
MNEFFNIIASNIADYLVWGVAFAVCIILFAGTVAKLLRKALKPKMFIIIAMCIEIAGTLFAFLTVWRLRHETAWLVFCAVIALCAVLNGVKIFRGRNYK